MLPDTQRSPSQEKYRTRFACLWPGCRCGFRYPCPIESSDDEAPEELDVP